MKKSEEDKSIQKRFIKIIQEKNEQAGAELCQAQLNLCYLVAI